MIEQGEIYMADLDDLTMRSVIRAIGHVVDSDCEPN